MRLESIFNNVDCKNKEINSNLFKKNINIIQSSRSGFSKDINSNKSMVRNNNNGSTMLNSFLGNQNNNLLNIITLNNNLKFNNLKNQNNILLQKKHRMDFKLQKSFDTDLVCKQNKNINMQTSLNLLNNKVKINIKKSDN